MDFIVCTPGSKLSGPTPNPQRFKGARNMIPASLANQEAVGDTYQSQFIGENLEGGGRQ
jgi:hypothetical protein